MTFNLFDWTMVNGEEVFAPVLTLDVSRADITEADIRAFLGVAVGATVELTEFHNDCSNDFDKFEKACKEAGFTVEEDARYNWCKGDCIIFDEKSQYVCEMNNYETYLKEQMEKFKRIYRSWDYVG